MKATFAVLTGMDTHNQVRRLAWELHRTYQTGLRACHLSPHISIKQPFVITDLAAIEGYFDEMAHHIPPFEVILPQLQVVRTAADDAILGIVWLNVEETPFLRQLHERVNRELGSRYENTQAPYDGTDYHFHLTIAISEQPAKVYRKIEAAFGAGVLICTAACESWLCLFMTTAQNPR